MLTPLILTYTICVFNMVNMLDMIRYITCNVVILLEYETFTPLHRSPFLVYMEADLTEQSRSLPIEYFLLIVGS